MGRETLEAEFGPYSEWMVDVLSEMSDPIPAACRGTGSPTLFKMAAGQLQVGTGARVLDLGCGLGGPGAWLSRHLGCMVVGIDVMETEIRGARKLFPEVGSIVATSSALPFRDSEFDAAWSLGALEMIEEKRDALTETHRVLKPGARFAIYGFIALEPLEHQPLGDHLVGRDELRTVIRETGFTIASEDCATGLQRGPQEWTDAVRHMRSQVARDHPGDPILLAEQRERIAFQNLWRSGKIEPWLIELVKESS
jgi:SAM-dependent methyltransferase